ncbi:hypothetical protein TNCV_3122611 [Trichonephila clavipes]|nr:hypothetical protein TNCV_3122611 [Trichonephila clavipes]
MKAVSVLEHFSDHGSIHQKMKKNMASVRSYHNSAGDGKTPYEEGLWSGREKKKEKWDEKKRVENREGSLGTPGS